jgi:hypothetical protein
MKRIWDRQDWRKKDINRVLRLRANDPATRDLDWQHASQWWDVKGAIYGLFHFTSGRWYVGQTKNEIFERGRSHWWSRFREEDLFHEALSLDPDPYHFIIIPLEWIPEHKWKFKYQGRLGNEREKRLFREAATPREKYWTGRVNSLWPYGWNSMVPGRPVGTYVLRKNINSHPLPSAEDPAFTPRDWLELWRKNPESSLKTLAASSKYHVREVLHFLQTYNTSDKLVSGLSPVTAIIDLLRKRREAPPKRQFLKVKFSSNSARSSNLRKIFRDPEVYEKHPDPEQAAAIMLVESFAPQIQALLFNYTDAARTLNPE